MEDTTFISCLGNRLHYILPVRPDIETVLISAYFWNRCYCYSRSLASFIYPHFQLWTKRQTSTFQLTVVVRVRDTTGRVISNPLLTGSLNKYDLKRIRKLVGPSKTWYNNFEGASTSILDSKKVGSSTQSNPLEKFYKTQCSLFTPPCSFNISTAFFALVNKGPSGRVTFPSTASITASSKPQPDDLIIFLTFSSFRTTEPSRASWAHHCDAREWRKGVVEDSSGIAKKIIVLDKKKIQIFFLLFRRSPVLGFWERIIAAWVYLMRWRAEVRWLRVCIVIEVSWLRGIWFCGWAWAAVVVEGGGAGMMVLRIGIRCRWR